MFRFRIAGIATAALTVVLSAALPAQGPQYHVVKRIVIGQARADYVIVDGVNRRLYGLGDKVIDVDKDTVIGTIPGGGGGYAIASDLNRGLVRNGTLFDLKTLAVTGHLAIRGDGSRYDPFTHRAFAWEGSNGWVIDMKTGTLITQTDIGDGLESGVADGKGKLYLNVEEAGAIEKFDATTLKIEATWPVSGCGTAQGLSMDQSTRRLFMACDKEMVVINADDGSVVARIPVPSRADMNCFDASAKLAFNPNRADSTLTVVHEDSPSKFTVVGKVPTGGGARTCAVDEKTHKVYVFFSDGPNRATANLVLAVLKR
ncbi:MAG TPA: hypothetical protein VGM77_12940 [Gemmatimonadales bacterium]|jgi:hypothetical protein